MPDETISDAGTSRGGRAVQSGGTPRSPGTAARAIHQPANSNHGATISDSQSVPGSSSRSGSLTQGAPKIQVVRRIGAGGMGTIFLGRDNRTHRWVAIKRLSGEFADDPRLRERFFVEAQSIAGLSHHHIVALYALDEDAGGPFLEMEYVAGRAGEPRPDADWTDDLPDPPLDLEQYIKRHGAMDVKSAAALGANLCGALSYAHKRGVIHRDVKPANVLLNEEMDPKLTDFGLARRTNHQAEGMTMAGAQLLTLGYGAPEQEIDSSRADERADLYGVGGTVWYALTGQSPRFYRESEVPPALRDVLSRAMQKDREKRFQTATELEEALSRAAGQKGVSEAHRSSGNGKHAAGACAQCGHEHALDPRSPLARKFCEKCGASLIEPCVTCNTENGVWSKFCGSCGADLANALQTVSESPAADQSDVKDKLAGSEFVLALATIERIGKLGHPRLFEFRDWARNLLPEALGLFQQEQRRRDEKLQLARTLAQQGNVPGR